MTRPIALIALLLIGAAQAVPWQPRSDQEIVQRLDSTGSERSAQRALQRRLAKSPQHEPSVLRLAGQWLAQAREQGDARFAGRALAVLQPFGEAPPPAVAVLRATLLQHLHQFDAAAGLLEQTLRREPALPQAWLLLASVRRTQARLADSDAACQGLAAAGAALHAAACRLENAGLRDPFQPLASWDRLLASERLDAPTRAWLLASKAEQAQRAGDAAASEAAWRAALAQHDEAYTRCQLADLLQAQGRHAEGLALLMPLPASDAVAVRRAALAQALGHPQATAWAAEFEERFRQSRERQAAAPQETAAHLREQAQFALWVRQRPEQAQRLARANLGLQREPIDLLLLAQAGAAAEAAQLARQWEIVDARVAAAR